MSRPTFEDAATLLIALVILVGAFYGLFRPDTVGDTKILYGGLVTLVGTYYFQRSAANQATRNTISAQNNGLDTIRATVARIEDARKPTESERAKRDKV